MRHFTKMHSCGIDYIYFDCLTEPLENPEALAVRLSNRHRGIGGDGIVLILPSNNADAKMRMFNSDGSESAMSGDALRCVGKYLYDKKIVQTNKITIDTLSGVKNLDMIVSDGIAIAAKADMGMAVLEPQKIPVDLTGSSVVARRINIMNSPFEITCVSMGNPHAVIFHEDIGYFDLETFGPAFETSALFPERVNLEVVQLIKRNHIKMRVFERGVGETQSSGTGACAAAVAAVLLGFCDKNTDIIVTQQGGDVVINYTDEAVYMTGECVTVFDGAVAL